MIDAAHLDALKALVGEDGLVSDPTAMGAYEQAARYGGGKAALVLRPASTAEVSAVVGYCVQNGLHLVPQGAVTGLVGGSTPDATGDQLVLSLERLKAPLQVDPVNRSALVGAGVRLSTLNDALAPHGLFLPIDLGADPMIGGMVATNTGGARFLRYGDMRRHVLGLEVVLADEEGTVLDLRNGLRKDNTAVDLRQLFIGSCGAFGVITRAEVEVHARPQQTAAALLIPRDDDAVVDILLALERAAGEYLTAFEGMSHNALAKAFGHVPGLRNPFAGGVIPPYALLVELTRSWAPREGETSLDDVLQACVGEIWEAPGEPLADALFGRPEELWAIRHALSEGLRASGPVTGFDLAFRRSDLVRFRQEAMAILARDFPEFELCDFGHVGDGGVHFNLVGSAPPERGAALREFVTDLAVRGYGGSFSGEHGLGRVNQGAYERYISEDVRALSARLQAVLTDAPFGSFALSPAEAD